ncbi:MAG: hypothetical protein AB7O38_07275 [Pirellulaceae bacterium]
MDDLLFHKAPLHAVLDAHLQKMKSYVGDLAPERVNAATDDELVAHIVAEYRIEPLNLHTDRAEAEHAETQVDVRHHFNRAVFDRSRPCLIKGNEITVHVPFTGDPQLPLLAPSTFNMNPPRGSIRKRGDQGGAIVMSLALPADVDETQFNRWIAEQLNGLRQHSEWSRRDVEAFNEKLEPQARAVVVARRAQLEKQGSLLKKLSVPLRRRDDAPNPAPVPMPKRVVKPLPAPRMVEQEYGLTAADYEYILKILRHESRSFEATPDAFVKLDEEELRDIVLAHLNGHFEGDAAGERFRRNGKTDICIEHENRAAFVAECKLWKGPKAFSEAIGQLLGYLTWRDTKTALLVWNKTVKDFAKLQDSVPQLLREHGRFVKMLDAGHTGEWRGVFGASSDDGREIIVHVFLVDLAHQVQEATDGTASRP